MGYGGYSVPCRVGNWAEDEYLGALTTAEHQKKESVGMLASQQLSSTLNNALSPVTLADAPTDGAIRFGDCVMCASHHHRACLWPGALDCSPRCVCVCAPTALTVRRSSRPGGRLSSALGGVIAFDTANRSELAQESYMVTRTGDHNAVACTRTAWTITPLVENGPADGLLRIGMPFALSCKGADGGMLYLQSQRYTTTNLNYAGTGGSGAGVVVVPAISADTAWKVVVLDPSDLAQFESMDQPVPANTFVSLLHANTCTLLFTQPDKYVKNKYGGEYLCSALTGTSINKAVWGKRIGQAVDVGNHYAFTTAEAKK